MGNLNGTEVDTLGFDDIYSRLSTSWESHQQLRMQGAPLSRLAESSTNLDLQRNAMWNWWREHQSEVVR